jgi:hypothetical protein
MGHETELRQRILVVRAYLQEFGEASNPNFARAVMYIHDLVHAGPDP